MKLLGRRLVQGVAVAAPLMLAAPAAAQGEPPPGSAPSGGVSPAPQPTAPASDCFPPCREGFVCSQGQCVSSCNPPCPAGQVCTAGSTCEPADATAAPAYDVPPPPPPKNNLGKRVHTMLAFHMGFGGSVEEDGTKTDLLTTYGVNVRTDFPVVRYLLIGPLVQFGAWRPEEPANITRDYYLDIDLFVRGRVPIELDSMGFQLWGGVPIGLTFSLLGEDHAQYLDGFGVGWNVGVLFGGAVHFTKRFGMFAEVGWLQHRMSHDRQVGTGSDDFKLSQTNCNLGFVFGG